MLYRVTLKILTLTYKIHHHMYGMNEGRRRKSVNPKKNSSIISASSEKRQIRSRVAEAPILPSTHITQRLPPVSLANNQNISYGNQNMSTSKDRSILKSTPSTLYQRYNVKERKYEKAHKLAEIEKALDQE